MNQKEVFLLSLLTSPLLSKLLELSLPFHFDYSSGKGTENLTLFVTCGRPSPLVCLQGMRLDGYANLTVVWIWMYHMISYPDMRFGEIRL